MTRGGDVYVTSSFRPTLWHVTADQARKGGGTPQALGVSSGIACATGFNLNGIVVKGHRTLIVVQTNTGMLLRRLGRGGSALDSIDEVAGVSVPGGDGLLLRRHRLVVVEGGPPAQLWIVRLSDRARSGSLVDTLQSAALVGSSTVARLRGWYLVSPAARHGVVVAGLL